MKINDIQNEGIVQKGYDLWNQSRLGSGLRAAFSNKSALDIAAKSKFVARLVSHLQSSVEAFIEGDAELKQQIENASADKTLAPSRGMQPPLAEMSYDVFFSSRDIDYRSRWHVRPAPASDAFTAANLPGKLKAPGVFNSQRRSELAKAGTQNRKATAPAGSQDSPAMAAMANQLGGQQSAATQPAHPAASTTDAQQDNDDNSIKSHIMDIMTNNVLRGINFSKQLPAMTKTAEAIDAAIMQGKSLNSLTAQFQALANVAWAAASAAKGAGSSQSTPAQQGGKDTQVDASKVQPLVNQVGKSFTSATDTGDLATLLAAVAAQFKKLGGKEDELKKVLNNIYHPAAPATTQPTTAP